MRVRPCFGQQELRKLKLTNICVVWYTCTCFDEFKTQHHSTGSFMFILPHLCMVVKSRNVEFTSYRFSNAKKCTNEGRALMQLDYQQFLMKLDSIMDLKYARLLVKIIEQRSMIIIFNCRSLSSN